MNKNHFYLLIFLFLFSCHAENKNKHEAGICLSFDDNSINEWFELRSLFKKHNATATFFITQPQTLTAEEIQKLKTLQKEGFEIGFHGYQHKSAEHYIRNHSYKEYLQNEIYPGIKFMDSIGIKCTSFAYPYGADYWFTDFLLLKHFKMVRDVSPLNTEKNLNKIDAVFYDFDGNRSLSAIGIDEKTGLDIKMIKTAFNRAIKNKEVLMLYGHIPTTDSTKKGYYFNVTFLENILSEAKNRNLKSYSFKDLSIAH